MLGQVFRQLVDKARGTRPLLSFIVCSIDDARFAAFCESLARHVSGVSHEVVRIGDARSLTEGYNRGMAKSRGELLVFCHDDIEFFQADLAQRIVAQLGQYDVAGVAGTSRMVDGYWGSSGQPFMYGQVLQKNRDKDGYTLYMFDFHDRPMPPIEGLDGLFIAARRKAAELLRFDETRFDGFHLYDADFSYRAHLAGLKVGVCRDILLYHHSHGDKNDEWKRYMDVFRDKFGDSLPQSWEQGPQYALTVQLDDKAGALPSFLDIRGNPRRYMEWTGLQLP